MKCPKCNGSGVVADQKEVGRKMRSLRVKQGIGLRAMARCMGISHGHLWQLESGRRSWSLTHTNKIIETCAVWFSMKKTIDQTP